MAKSGSSPENNVILTGNPVPTVILFALPIILGNIFQQLYNIVDAIVVGRLLGDLPLAGISMANPVMDVANALIIGGTIGVGVLTAKLYGGREFEDLKKANSTALIGGTAITLLIALVGFFGSVPLLLLQGTDPTVAEESGRYLHIIFAGLIFTFLYNYFASLLRSCGDSRTPFIILLVSSTLHAFMDFFLAGTMGLGIRGVALSTVLCQCFSACCCIFFAFHSCPQLRLGRGELRFIPSFGALLFSYAWAAALQQAVVCVSRLLIQGLLTTLGTDTVTGYNMSLRVEAFIFCFSQGIGASMVVCISQNKGNHDPRRMQLFFYRTLLVEITVAFVVAFMCRLVPRQLIGIFTNNSSVLDAGAAYTGTMAFLYLPAFCGEIIQGFFRGLGRLRLTMVASLLQVSLRLVLAIFMIPRMGIYGLCWSVGIGWILMVLIEGTYALVTARGLTKGGRSV